MCIVRAEVLSACVQHAGNASAFCLYCRHRRKAHFCGMMGLALKDGKR